MLDTLFLLTDASFQPEVGAGLGAALVSSCGEVMQWFGIQLTLKQLSTLMEDGRETIIGELEKLAVSLAPMLWVKHLDSMQLLVYVTMRALDVPGSKDTQYLAGSLRFVLWPPPP